ncbi:hypothetical protein SDJN03_19949, partial [Cucurbita argyrosperma subsp. sororia]
MGCCVSTSRTSNSSSPPHHSGSAFSHSKSDHIGNRAPPPLEEESVKEVLSETPKPKPPPIGGRKLHESASGNLNGGIPIHSTEEISEISDVCSFNESLSTTTVTEKLDDFEEIRKRICRSPAKLPKNRSSLSDDWVQRRDRIVGKSPTRKPDQSPGRINSGAGTVKLVQSRDMGQGLLASRSLRPEQRVQNRTENSYRRSRSPATTRTDGEASRTAAGRSPSVRRSGMSPGREATTGGDYYRKETGEVHAQNETIEGKRRTTNESLDNPLVSLECFIFL